jgi:hypothetical protein
MSSKGSGKEQIATSDKAEASSTAIDAAWKIHAAQVDWTGKVDGKAVFAFGIQSAALGLVVTLSSAGRVFAEPRTQVDSISYYLAVAALLVGVGCALFVVKPRLRGRAARREAGDGYVYFGHLRHWSADNLVQRLRSPDDLLDVLANQCVTMAKISWTKHRLVQISMLSGASGILLLVVTGINLA